MPGHNGGANFATAAVDPTRGEMYVVAKALPTVVRLTLPGQAVELVDGQAPSSHRSRRHS